MKTIASFITITLLGIQLWAVNAELETAVQGSLQRLHAAQTFEDAREAVNQLERITQAAPHQWQVHYHFAYGNIQLSFRETDPAKKDQLLDIAEAAIKKGHDNDGDASELLALQAFVFLARLSADGSRAMQYSGYARNTLAKALAENPNNPRALFLNGQNVYHTPAAFGGGSKNALPWFEKSVESFHNNEIANPIDPFWGEQAAQAMLEQCQK